VEQRGLPACRRFEDGRFEEEALLTLKLAPSAVLHKSVKIKTKQTNQPRAPTLHCSINYVWNRQEDGMKTKAAGSEGVSKPARQPGSTGCWFVPAAHSVAWAKRHLPSLALDLNSR